tara:strand:- start:521 stop:742 length:222 start_codon:yes stop_codon:yes gene_type:complete
VRYSRFYIILSIFVFNLLSACAVCYGAPDHPVTQGLNKAILFLLGTIVFVLSCIMYSIFVLIKRSKNVQNEGI